MQNSFPIPNVTHKNDESDVIHGEVVPFEVAQTQNEKQKTALNVMGFAVVRQHTGPLPAAPEFAQYERAVPGSAERIIGMAEKEQTHRHSEEKRTTLADIGLQYLGLFFVVGLAVFGVWKGCNLIQDGHEKSGLAVIGTCLLGILGSVIKATITARSERQALQGQITIDNTPKASSNGQRKQQQGKKKR